MRFYWLGASHFYGHKPDIHPIECPDERILNYLVIIDIVYEKYTIRIKPLRNVVKKKTIMNQIIIDLLILNLN